MDVATIGRDCPQRAIYALSAVLGLPIRVVYPDASHPCNMIVVGRDCEAMDYVVVNIMWSMAKFQKGRLLTPNHFVTLLPLTEEFQDEVRYRGGMKYQSFKLEIALFVSL